MRDPDRTAESAVARRVLTCGEFYSIMMCSVKSGSRGTTRTRKKIYFGLTLSSEILESTARQIELEEICLREPSVGCQRQLGRVGHHVGVRYVKVA